MISVDIGDKFQTIAPLRQLLCLSGSDIKHDQYMRQVEVFTVIGVDNGELILDKGEDNEQR